MLFLQWNSFLIKRDVQLREEILSRVLSHDLNQENNIISEHIGYFCWFLLWKALCKFMELFHGDGAIELYFRFCNATREIATNFPTIIVMRTSVFQRVPHGFEAWASKQDFWCRDYGKGDNLQLRSKATSLATWDVRFVHNKTFGTSHLQKKELPSKRGPLLKWCHLSEMN